MASVLRAAVVVLLTVGMLASAAQPIQDSKGKVKGKQPVFLSADSGDYRGRAALIADALAALD